MRHTAAALEALVPADILNLRPGQQRYTQLLNDAGGIIDDLMVTRSASAEDDGSLLLVVNASRKEVDYAHISSRLPAGVMLLPAPERALLALQGPAAKDSDGASSPTSAAGLAFMRRGQRHVSASFDCHISPLRLHGRGRLRDFGRGCRGARSWRGCCWRRTACSRSASARATRCGSRRASASTATTSTRPRARSRPGLAWSIQKRRRSEGGFPGAEAHPGRAGARADAQPRRHQAGRARAGARGHRDPGAAGRAHRRRHVGRLRPQRQRPGGDGLRRGADHAAVGTPVNLMVRGKALSAARRAAAVRAAPLRPQELTRERGSHGHRALHQGPRMDPRRRRHRAPSASPTTRRASSATSCSSSCPRSAARSSRARRWPWWRASRRRATSSRRCAGEVVEANGDLAGHAGARQRGRRGQGLVLQAQDRRRRPSSTS